MTIADVLYPGLLHNDDNDGGLRLWIGGSLADDLQEKEQLTRQQFDEALGVLRASKFGRGEVQDKVARSPAWDSKGNVVVRVGTVKAYVRFGDEEAEFARRAKGSAVRSHRLRSALILHGKANRTAADFYNIYEYAEDEFGGEAQVRKALGISRRKQRLFRAAANNLSPLDGGRHAANTNPGAVRMTPVDLAEFAADLLRSWILI